MVRYFRTRGNPCFFYCTDQVPVHLMPCVHMLGTARDYICNLAKASHVDLFSSPGQAHRPSHRHHITLHPPFQQAMRSMPFSPTKALQPVKHCQQVFNQDTQCADQQPETGKRDLQGAPQSDSEIASFLRTCPLG